MQPTWLQDTAYDSSGQFYIFTCLCPGTTAAVGGIPVCLCDNTNQPMQSPGSLFGMCPPLSCGAGQVEIDNKCVATCSDPTEIMLSGGQCGPRPMFGRPGMLGGRHSTMIWHQ